MTPSPGRRSSSRRTKFLSVHRIRQFLVVSAVVFICSLTYLVRNIPSSSHNDEPEVLARLRQFSDGRNLSMENSGDSKKDQSRHNSTNKNESPLLQPPTKEVISTETKNSTTTQLAQAPLMAAKMDTADSLKQLSEQVESKQEIDRVPKIEEKVVPKTQELQALPALEKAEALLSDLRVSVAKILQNHCENPVVHGDTLGVTFVARHNKSDGYVYAKSRRAVEITVGSNDLIPGLHEGLLGACQGDRRQITVPFQMAFRRKQTDRMFRVPKSVKQVVWVVDVVSVNEDEDEEEGLADDDGIPEDSSEIHEKDKKDPDYEWKVAVGLIVETKEKVPKIMTNTSVVQDCVNETIKVKVKVNDTDVVLGTNSTNSTHFNATNGTVVKKTKKTKTRYRYKTENRTVCMNRTVYHNYTIEVEIDATYMPKQPKAPTRLALKPAVPYLGVLIDGGRHYFPLSWLKEAVDVLHMLRYNFIHLRLTDDQAFNIRLNSHPSLAVPAPPTAEDGRDENPVWTRAELSELVDYAYSKNITIMPEINVPGHCASWGGIPNLVIPCPYFSCDKGYGVPLNETNPRLIEIVSDVIGEVNELFHTSPYIHLGGDEVHMSEPCFREVGEGLFDYNGFEQDLQAALAKLKIPEENVVRWETTGQTGIDTRAGTITQWWLTFPRGKSRNGPFFTSQGLYFDSCGQREGREIFEHSQMLAREGPTAIIGGTFELSTHWWTDRNVFGRLLAVAMGASKEGQNLPWSNNMYIHFCNTQGWPDKVCEAAGYPLIHTNEWLKKWKDHWVTWKAATCERLSEAYEERVINDLIVDKEGASVFEPEREVREAQPTFWDNFGEVAKLPDPPNTTNATALEEELIFKRAVPHLGVTMNFPATEEFNFSKAMVTSVSDALSKLGFNMIHLRVVDDFTFPIELDFHHNIAWDGTVFEHFVQRRRHQQTIFHAMSDNDVLPVNDVRVLVELADSRGIKVMPELNILSRAGGWFRSGLVARCPDVMCETDFGLPLDITYPPVLSMLSNVIFEMRTIFTSEYLHLGYDEREESRACFDELQVSPNFDLFEQKLMALLELQGIPAERVLRWESSETTTNATNSTAGYRAGNITHHHTTHGPQTDNKERSFWESLLSKEEEPTVEPFFVSTGLDHESADNKTDAWSIYLHTRSLMARRPTGILNEYLAIDYELWEAENVIGKLIAVAIGASDMPKMEKEKFRVVFDNACLAIEGNWTNSCGLFGMSDSTLLAALREKGIKPAYDESEVGVAKNTTRQARCDALTHIENRRRPAKGVVE